MQLDNLSVEVTTSTTSVGVGQTLIYKVLAKNNSSLIATSVVVEETVPAGVCLSGISVTTGNYNYQNDKIIWSIGTLGPGEESEMTVTVIPGRQGNIEITANITGIVDGDDVENEATLEVEVTPAVDLIIMKDGFPTSTNVGSPYEYSIVVYNNGPSEATGVVVTDTLPSGVNLESDSIVLSQGTSSLVGDQLTIELGNLDVNNRATIRFTVIPTSEGEKENSVEVTSNETDINPVNNHATTTTFIGPAEEANLSVTKNASENPVGVGRPLTFTTVAKNNGPVTTTSVVLEDTLTPTNAFYLSDISVTQGNYSYQAGAIVWNIGVLNPGEEQEMTVTVIPISHEDILESTATIYSNAERYEDEDYTDNSVSLQVTVTPSVELRILKESFPTSTTVGNPFEYSIVVYNNGPSIANEVVVTDTLPSEVNLNPGSIVLSQGSSTLVGNQLTIELGSLDVNSSATIRFTVTPISPGEIVNSVEVTCGDIDVTKTANATTVIMPAPVYADISIEAIYHNNVIVLGNNLKYYLIVKNNSTSTPATNVLVEDNLPSDVDIISTTPSYDSLEGGVLGFKIDELAANDTRTIEIEIKPQKTGMINKSSYVSANEEDPNECNNIALICVYVREIGSSVSTDIGSTDISVVKSHTPEPAGMCSHVTYTLTVKNEGEEIATGITLVDQIPPSLELISVITSKGECCILGNRSGCHPSHEKKCGRDRDICESIDEIVCQLGTLAVGDSATVQVVVKPKVLGEIKNTAIATANQKDPNPGNNTATDTVNVITPCERIDFLINEVNELITSGGIEEEYGNELIGILNDASASCNSKKKNKKTRCLLGCFIDKVELFIKNEYISGEQGRDLIEATDTIIQELTCCR